MIRRAYHRWLDRRTGYWRRRAELAEGERDAAIATLWLVRDALGILHSGGELQPGEGRQILDAADGVLDRILTTHRR